MRNLSASRQSQLGTPTGLHRTGTGIHHGGFHRTGFDRDDTDFQCFGTGGFPDGKPGSTGNQNGNDNLDEG
jgi:hypothetical protein